VPAPAQLKNGPLSPHTLHLCIDMQRLFGDGGPWHTPWMPRVLPVVTEIARRHARRTLFTRFVPPQRPEDMPGRWRAYYEHWRGVTREQLDPGFLELMPGLAELVPPATVMDKAVYSPFHGTGLAQWLRQRSVDTLVFTGAETDVCVLGGVMDAVDLGLRTIVVRDAVCSYSDESHDALLGLYRRRFTHQIEIADAELVLRQWDA
jgi:nicotinamidase-related amidase